MLVDPILVQDSGLREGYGRELVTKKKTVEVFLFFLLELSWPPASVFVSILGTEDHQTFQDPSRSYFPFFLPPGLRKLFFLYDYLVLK